MREAYSKIDEELTEIFLDYSNQNLTFIFFSDHGSAPKGNHFGTSDDERIVPWIVYS